MRNSFGERRKELAAAAGCPRLSVACPYQPPHGEDRESEGPPGKAVEPEVELRPERAVPQKEQHLGGEERRRHGQAPRHRAALRRMSTS